MKFANETRGRVPSAAWPASFCFVGLVFSLCLGFVSAFGVNVPHWDEWQLLEQIRQIHSGHLDWWRLLFERHNEHPMGVPFLIESLQLLATGLDYKLLLVTGVLIQAVTFALFAAVLWRSIPPNLRPAWLAVSSLIWFSLAQYQNLLWAFQNAWFWISFFLAASLLCLRRVSQFEDAQRKGGAIWLALAVASALLASFTSFQGVIVWFAGAILLSGYRYYRKTSLLRSGPLRNWLICMCLGGILIVALWLKAGNGDSVAAAKFSFRTWLYIFVATHGDFWGNLGKHGLIAAGALMLVFVLLALVKVLVSRERAEYALAVALVAFGLSFVFLISVGRAKFGVGPGSDSHYTAYLVMTYFGVLCILLRRDETVPDRFAPRWAAFVYCALIALASFSSSYCSVLRGLEWRADRGIAAVALVNYRAEPDFVLSRLLFGDVATVRRNAEFLETFKYGPFGDPRAIPPAVSAYIALPKSMQAVIARYPGRQEAIQTAWQVYRMGGDLRHAFNPVSDRFAREFLDWCEATTRSPSSHYLGEYLVPFSADYAAIKKAETAAPDSR